MASSSEKTTKKHELFISSPLGQKDVSDIPGIGLKYADALHKRGITKVPFLSLIKKLLAIHDTSAEN